MKFQELLHRASAGDAESQVQVGFAYSSGEYESAPIQQNANEALRWFQEAANKGNVVAIYNLGVFYRQGIAVPQDYSKAITFFTTAAASGHSSAIFNIGTMYYAGEGVAQDYSKAVEFFKKAAEAGSGDACTNLGVIYHNGDGVVQNDRKALEWFGKAMDLGSFEAATNSKMLYWSGDDGESRKSFDDYAKDMMELHRKLAAGDQSAFGQIQRLRVKLVGISHYSLDAIIIRSRAAAQVAGHAFPALLDCHSVGLWGKLDLKHDLANVRGLKNNDWIYSEHDINGETVVVRSVKDQVFIVIKSENEKGLVDKIGFHPNGFKQHFGMD